VIRYKSIAKGAGSYFIKAFRKSGTGTDGAFSAEGSYAIFMRYLMALEQIGVSFENKVVLEFGPGSSYGMGIAALLSGAKRYYALDLIDHTTDTRNLAVFEEMASMFTARAPVSISGWCARIFPFIDEPAFPKALLPDSLLAWTLSQERLNAIRRDLETRGEVFIRARSSGVLRDVLLDEKADIIVSESVLEHVDDLKSTYEAFGRWLARDGAMAHLIDYSSHNLSPDWNGHWQCSPFLWSLVRGKRYYLINRMPHQTHLDLLNANGLRVVHSQLLRRVDGLTPDQFSSEFRGMSLRDATTALAAIVCQRVDSAGDQS
jgi:Methyltransferase domain